MPRAAPRARARAPSRGRSARASAPRAAARRVTTATDAPARSQRRRPARRRRRASPAVEPSDTRRTSAPRHVILPGSMTGTLINVGAVLLGTLIGDARSAAGCPSACTQRVLFGLGMVTLVLGHRQRARLARGAQAPDPRRDVRRCCSAASSARLLRIEDRLAARSATASRRGSPASDGGSTASSARRSSPRRLLFCVGPLTVLGSIDDGLTGDIELLATKSLLDGFASIALAAALGPGVALAAVSVLVIQGGISLGAGAVRGHPRRRAARRADQRGRRAHHRDRAEAARHQGRARSATTCRRSLFAPAARPR